MTKNKRDFFVKRKKENYYKEAKKIDVRARSYFKLEQIDRKYEILNDNMHIIDLGCAPGGWLQYIDKKVKTGKVIGIDLLELKNHKDFSENIQIIEDDFDNIEEYVDEKFDLVLSDMAPEFSGKPDLDKGRTHKLNLKTLEFSQKYLKTTGNLVFKSFEGEDLGYVVKKAKEMFEMVKEYKPLSSQEKSAEVFIICICKFSNRYQQLKNKD